MEFVRMGCSGLKITSITFGAALTIGTEDHSEAFASSLIDKAWQLGIRSFDVSNNYGMGLAESLVGKALLKYNRQEYVLATKGSWPIGETPYHRGLSRKHILWALEDSLKRLDMEYVDVYFAHRYDSETSMEEIVRTFNSLINSGKIRYWATSEWPISALEECHEICDRLGLEKPIIEQFIYSFAIRKAETNGVKAFCERNGVGMMGFSPLAQGLLTGKYENGIPQNSRIAKSDKINYSKTINIYDQNKSAIDCFVRLCHKYEVKGSHAAIQWCIRNKVFPVLGTSNPQQLEENTEGLNVKIPNQFWDELSNIF